MMQVLLLSDVKGVGKKNDLLVVGNGFALNFLLPERKAIVVTPSVRRRYAEQIKERALQREREKLADVSALAVLQGKKVTLEGRASKTGKLYAAISQRAIVDALKKNYEVDVKEAAVRLDEPIKNTGTHTVNIQISGQSVPVMVEVKPAKDAQAA